jgi:hypothetical protein
MITLCPLCAADVGTERSSAGREIATHACRADYDALRRRERSDLRYMQVHSLTVDAWSVQHPGPTADDSARRIGVHLVSLYAQLALGLSYREARQLRQRAGETIEFRALPLPDLPAELSVQHVLASEHPDVHRRLVEEWARSVWRAWHPHRDQVMSWTRRIVGHGRVAEPPREECAGWYAGARNAVHPVVDRPGSER